MSALGTPREGDGGDGHRDRHRDDEDRDEDRDEDPELRAMRAVWHAMHDEDPPDRGLAELLAAARETAAAMQARPALWRRVIAGLGRPMALALATVMVLVAGAAILGRHGAGGRAPARAPEVPGGLAAAPIAPGLPTPVMPARTAPGRLDADSARLPAPRVDDASLLDASPNTAVRGVPSPAAARDQARAPAELAGAARTAHDESGMPPAEASAPARTQGRATATDPKHDTYKARPGAPLAQLHEQCESAARRGDCATVRRVVGLITRSDPRYRARLAKDSPIARCLSHTAATSTPGG